MGIAAQQIQGVWVKCIDARINMAASHRFFLETNNFDALSLHYPKGMLPFVHSHGHSSGCVLADMKIQQFAVTYVCNNIAIGNYKSGFWSWIE